MRQSRGPPSSSSEGVTTAIPRWIERKFNFDLPVSFYPNILARVRGTPARLEEAVGGLSREALIAKSDDKWSIQENAGHLLDEETLFSTRLQEFLAGSKTLTPAAYQNLELTHNAASIDEILRRFREARCNQVNQLLQLREEEFARTAWHSRLNVPMRLIDHLVFVAEHDDHHLARIWELRQRSQP